MPKTTTLRAKNNTSSTISVGKIVYAAGYDAGAFNTLIDLADNTDSDKLPAIGALVEDGVAGQSDLRVRTSGPCSGFDTVGVKIGTEVYVGREGRVFYGPPAVGSIQQIGVVLTQNEYPYGQIQVLPHDIKTAERRHNALNDITPNQHHLENHAHRHRRNGADPLNNIVEGNGESRKLAVWTNGQDIGASPATIDSAGNLSITAMNQYLCATLTADNTGQSGLFNPFNTTSYGGTASTLVSNGITYDSSTGGFTIVYDGVYEISIVSFLEQNINGALDTFRVRKNTATTPVILWDGSGSNFIHSSVDPVERSIIFMESLSEGDILEFEMNSTDASTLVCHSGTTFNIKRIA